MAGPGALAAGRDRAALVAEVARVLEAVAVGARAVVACSGGPDSVALAHLAAEARPDLDLVMAHVRHGLRPAAAEAADLAVVRGHAEVLDAELEVERVDVTPAGRGVEDAARTARHAALRAVARRNGARLVLLGHTADDQAETVLLRLARGTGLDGLAGMREQRGDRLRPLLRVRRADVEAFVRGEGLDHVVDETNASDAFARNRARHEVLPVLARLAPDPVGALARLADLAAADASHLDRAAAALADAHGHAWGPTWSVRDDVLAEVGVAMARRLVRRAVVGLRDEPNPPTAAQVDGVLAVPNGRLAVLEGVRVSRGAGWLAFAPTDPPDHAQRPLRRPGRTAWPAAGLDLVATTPGGARHRGQLPLALPATAPWQPPDVAVDAAALPPSGDAALGQVVLPADALARDVAVRARREGDRVRTTVGTRLLSDVLVDRGVPRVLRDLLPVVVVGGVVAWVPGVVVDAGLAEAGRRAPALHVAAVAALPAAVAPHGATSTH